MHTLPSGNERHDGMKAIEIELKVKYSVEIMDLGLFGCFFFSRLSTRQSSDTAIVAPDPANIYQFEKFVKKNPFQRCRNKKKISSKIFGIGKTEGNTKQNQTEHEKRQRQTISAFFFFALLLLLYFFSSIMRCVVNIIFIFLRDIAVNSRDRN